MTRCPLRLTEANSKSGPWSKAVQTLRLEGDNNIPRNEFLPVYRTD